MIAGAQNIFKIPELKRRILMTFLFLAIYRVGVHIPTPGINGDALASFFAHAKGTLFSLIDMFSGGAMERLSVFALGIMPRAKTESLSRAPPENISMRLKRVPFAWAKKEARASPLIPGVGIWTPTR